MRWRRSSSTQVEDRRGGGGFGGGLGGGLGGMRMGGGGIPLPIGGGVGGLVLLVIVVAVVYMLSGSGSGGQAGGLQGAPGGAIASLAPGDDQAQFINAVTVDVQTFWAEEFAASGKTYPQTVLVLFSGSTQSGCGVASSQTGPFYCPADEKVYLDAGFFDELHARFGAKGDFAEAYVIAHEFGHHVQDALGTMDRVAQLQQSQPGDANDLSIRLELQADCLAGVWGAHAKQERDFIESGDIEEALKAASAIGDDRLQQQTQGRVVPESFTHGTSEQRVRWFKRGMASGRPQDCDTFSSSSL